MTHQTTAKDPLQSEQFLEHCLADARACTKGVYAEFGVLYGQHFVPIAAEALSRGTRAYAVDSFRGMAKPTANDRWGAEQYPEGRFDQGGPARFIETMKIEGFKPEEYHFVEGFIPSALHPLQDLCFSFAYIDLDHYQPTMDVLKFLWPRIHENSVVMVDDFSWDRECLAALAYKHFFERHKGEIEINVYGREAAFRKRRIV